MILSTEAVKHVDMGPIFGVFFGFWAFVLVALWVGTGILLKMREKALEKSQHHGDH